MKGDWREERRRVLPAKTMDLAKAAHNVVAIFGDSFPAVVIVCPYLGFLMAIMSQMPEKIVEYIDSIIIDTANQLPLPALKGLLVVQLNSLS